VVWAETLFIFAVSLITLVSIHDSHTVDLRHRNLTMASIGSSP